MALGALAALAKLGLSAPDDVPIVELDDIAGADHFVPSLATVRQDLVTLGSTAIETLLSTMAGQEPVHRQTTPTLVVRESAAAPISHPSRQRESRPAQHSRRVGG